MFKGNITLTTRERGKIRQRWEGDNIWVDGGRTFLSQLMSYSSYAPLTPAEDRRVRYIGFGIGGYRQTNLGLSDNPPLSVDYPGANTQTDMQPAVSQIQRPVRVSPGVFLRELPVPTISSTFFYAQYSFTLGLTDITYGSYLYMPISEVALYLTDANTAVGTNPIVGYEASEPVLKTQNFTLDVNWAVRF